ncbi:MAG: hypothetical protein PHT12_02450 [Patescibacteria group bacterium]|nr:hypothetical protein [Patescibacteria group bacterium]
MSKGLKLLLGSVTALLLGLCSFWVGWLNHTNINQIGVAYNSFGGNVWIQDRPGWYITPPTVKVAYISTLPIKVTVPSNAVVIITKVVRFRPEGVDAFIRQQGFSYFSSSELENILMGYAFSGGTYPFLEIVQDTGQEKVNDRPVQR